MSKRTAYENIETPAQEEPSTSGAEVADELDAYQTRRPIVLFPTGRPGFDVIGIGKAGSWVAVRPPPALQSFEASDVVPQDLQPKKFYPVPPLGPPRRDGLVYPVCGEVKQVYGRRCKTGVWEEIRVDFSNRDRETRRDRALRTAIHDSYRPLPDPIKGYPEELDVPGQHQMTPGVPVIAVDSNDPTKFLTIACGHTMSSLSCVPGIDRGELVADMTTLAKLWFGDPDSMDAEKRKPATEMAYSANLRSAKSTKLSGEGSFSMALTSGEGQGKGQVQPAVQNTSAEGVRRRLEANRITGKWNPRIRAASNLREDYDAQLFLGTQCNIPSCGDPANKFTTSAQLNLSILRDDNTELSDSLGNVQAKQHVDHNDHLEAKTDFYPFLKVSPGSDPGAFMFPEQGLFWHSWEPLYSTSTYVVLCSFLDFSGRNMHGPISPRLFKPVPGEQYARAGLVTYANQHVLGRSGTMARGPPDLFSTGLEHPLHSDKQLTVIEHGDEHFGSAVNKAEWVAREIALTHRNGMAIGCGTGVFQARAEPTLSTLMTQFRGPNGEILSTGGILDPWENREEHDRQMKYYEMYRQRVAHFSLLLTRDKMKAEQSKNRRIAPNSIPPYFDTGATCEASMEVTRMGRAIPIANSVAFALEVSSNPGKWVWVHDSNWEDGEYKRFWVKVMKAQALKDQATLNAQMALLHAKTSGQQSPEESMDTSAALVPLGCTPGSIHPEQAGNPAGSIATEPEPSSSKSGKRGRQDDNQSSDTDTTSKRRKTKHKEGKGKAKGKGKGKGKKPESAPQQTPPKRIINRRQVADSLQSLPVDLDDFYSSIVDGRRHFLMKALNYGFRELSVMLENYEQQTAARTISSEHTIDHSLISLRVMLEAARVHPLVQSAHHAAKMLTAFTRIVECETLVQFKDWIVRDGPALAAFIFGDMDVGGEPARTEIDWLDELVEHLVQFAKSVQDGSLAKQKEIERAAALAAKAAIQRAKENERIAESAQATTATSTLEDDDEGFESEDNGFGSEEDSTPYYQTLLKGAPSEAGWRYHDQEAEALALISNTVMLDWPAAANGDTITPASSNPARPPTVAEKIHPSVSTGEAEILNAISATEVSLPEDAPSSGRLGQHQTENEDNGLVGVRHTQRSNFLNLSQPSVDKGDSSSPLRNKAKVAHSLSQALETAFPNLRTSKSKSKTASQKVKLHLTSRPIPPGPGRLQIALCDLFIDALFTLAIYPAVRNTLHTMGVRRRWSKARTSLRSMQDQIVTRGTTLDALALAAGSRTIFAIESLEAALLQRPHALFVNKTWSGVDKFAPVLRNDSAAFEEALRDAFASWFTKHPAVLQKLEQAEKHFLYHVAELRAHHKFPAWETGPDEFLEPGRRSVTVRGVTGLPYAKIRPSLNDLIFGDVEVGFRIGYLVASVALERLQQPPCGPGNPEIAGFFSGLHPRQRDSETRYTQDQMNAIPASWVLAKMLKRIPHDVWRTGWGFANIMLFFATGQSQATQPFWDVWSAKLPQSATEMKDIWRTCRTTNDMALSELSADSVLKSTSYLLHCPTFKILENPNVWGQYCSSFTFGPNGERIDEIFDPQLMEKWEKHCSGDSPKTWVETLAFISKFQISPFKGNSLSAFRLANALAEAGVCKPPSLKDVAIWISQHTDLGAYRGLHLLGFIDLPTVDHIIIALSIVDLHYSEFYLPTHKDMMQYGPIYLENWLCKVFRTVSLFVNLLRSTIETLDRDWAIPYSSSTSRLVKYKPVTEMYLRKLGVQYISQMDVD